MSSKFEFDGRKVEGDFCLRCQKIVEWFSIPDSLASACKACGFVRVGCKEGGYTAGASLQEWAKDIAEIKATKEQAT